jgi:hypothetical protein
VETEHEDGIIGFPLVTDRMKLVTVGVCEWTVTLVKEQQISEHASLKGNTNVVCTFTEEAERHCKHAGEVLEEGLTVSGQGLVYNFDNAQYGAYKVRTGIKLRFSRPRTKAGYFATTKLSKKGDLSTCLQYEFIAFSCFYVQGKTAADKKDEEEAADGLDVYLALINGVVGRNKDLKYDNGALQYFFGVPPTGLEKARDAMTASVQSGESPTPETLQPSLLTQRPLRSAPAHLASC